LTYLHLSSIASILLISPLLCLLKHGTPAK
jgi:hypothetical protein